MLDAGNRGRVPSETFGSLGNLSRAQLQAAVDRFGLGRLKRAWPLTEGLFGKNIAIDTTSGPWVLRGDPWPAASDYQYRKEAFFARAIHKGCSIPAPWPYRVESRAGMLPWPYALMPRLDGHGVDLADPEFDWMEIAEALGSGLAELHRVGWACLGEWRPEADAMVAFEGSAAQWLESRLAAWLFTLSTPLDARSEAILLAHLTAAQSELDHTSTQATYVHHDYKPTNLSFSRDTAGRVEVVGVFDLNEGYAADPLEDLPRTLSQLAASRGAAVAARFLRTYGAAAGRDLSPSRVLAYTAFDLLVIWEFGIRPERSWFEQGVTFADWAEPRLNAVSNVLDGT
jgi:hygromycin-B 7''-O-kinase